MLAEMRHAIHDSKSLVPLFDMIWENPNPNQAADEIRLSISNLDDYNMFVIEFVNIISNSLHGDKTSITIYAPDDMVSTDNEWGVTKTVTSLDISGNPMQINTRGVLIRKALTQDNIVFYGGEKMLLSDLTNIVADNNACVPLRVLGTKI